MENPALDTFMINWLKTHEQGVLPGAMLMRHGPVDYVGAALAVRGTLYFRGSHTDSVREEICRCFDDYEAIAKSHLTRLWREEPPEGPDKFAYPKAKPLREMMRRMDADDHIGFRYTGGRNRTMPALGCSGYLVCAGGKQSSAGTDSIHWNFLCHVTSSKNIQRCFSACLSTSHDA